jgi:hypothetical protein
MNNSVLNYMKQTQLLGLLIGVLLCKPAAAEDNEFRCLKSVGLKNPVNFQFTFRADTGDLGYVSYQRGTGRIQVKKNSEKELRRVPGGRPSEFETTWEEITPDASGGSYVMVSQGARLYNFRYIRKKDGKVLKFEEDPEAFTDKGCDWKNR